MCVHCNVRTTQRGNSRHQLITDVAADYLRYTQTPSQSISLSAVTHSSPALPSPLFLLQHSAPGPSPRPSLETDTISITSTHGRTDARAREPGARHTPPRPPAPSSDTTAPPAWPRSAATASPTVGSALTSPRAPQSRPQRAQSPPPQSRNVGAAAAPSTRSSPRHRSLCRERTTSPRNDVYSRWMPAAAADTDSSQQSARNVAASRAPAAGNYLAPVLDSARTNSSCCLLLLLTYE